MDKDIIAERRPITESSWDGAGLPPVGCEFEYQDHRGEFIRSTMDYCGKDFAIVHHSDLGDSWLRLAGVKLRPIRSEADKKRDDALLAMNIAVNEGDAGIEGGLEAIYDAIAAGKIPGVKLED